MCLLSLYLNDEPRLLSLAGCAEGDRTEGQTAAATQTQARGKSKKAGIVVSQLQDFKEKLIINSLFKMHF